MTNMREKWRTVAVRSASGPTMKPGRVGEEQQRQVERVAQLHEARRLVGAVGVDRAAEMGRVVGDDAERPAVDARERGDDPGAEAAPQLERLVAAARRSPCGRRRCACGWRGSGRAAGSGRGDAVGRRRRPTAEEAQVPLGGRDRLGVVGDAQVDDPVGVLDVDRADLLRLVDTRGRRPRSSPGRPCRCSRPRSR